jgi:hypothetical protein
MSLWDDLKVQNKFLWRRHAAARANYKSLAQELERGGAQMAIKNKPDLSRPPGPPAKQVRP